MQERRKQDTDKALEDHSKEMQAELESLLKPSSNLNGPKRVTPVESSIASKKTLSDTQPSQPRLLRGK
jgi:hypothetical protein